MGSFHSARAMLLFLTLLLLFLPTRVNGQLPQACPLTFSTMGRTPCCPVWADDGSICGRNSGRGICQQGPTNKPTNQDERLNYPWGFYSSICVCNYPFRGHNCGDCTYNHHGATCTDTYQVVRPEIRTLTEEELSAFLGGLQMLKSTMSDWCAIPIQQGSGSTKTMKMVNASMYDCLAAGHTLNSKGLLNLNNDPIHRGPGFITYHRFYVLEMERAMQKILRNYLFGFPYYDWRFDGNSCLICNTYYLGASNYAGYIDPFHFLANWKVVCQDTTYSTFCMMPENECLRSPILRQPGRNERRMPTWQEVADCMKFTSVDTPPYNQTSRNSFRNCAEGWVAGDGITYVTGNHNLVHVFLGGDQLNPLTAASDPMFFLHHSMVDSIMDWWIIRNEATLFYPQNNVAGHRPTDNIVGSFPAVPHTYFFQKLENFGSTYQYYYPIA